MQTVLTRPVSRSTQTAVETVLITGASEGIGRGLTKLFAADGARLVLIARRTERLLSLVAELPRRSEFEHVIIPIDLSQPDAAQAIVDELARRNVTVDVLVNNAGFGHNDQFLSISIEEQLRMVQVNIAAMMHLTHLLVPQMIERGKGAILNLGSTASFQPGPYSAVYFATKAFVLSFSESLWEELREYQISVTCLCPGPTETKFAERAGMSHNWNFVHASMSADDVCRIGYRGFRRRQRLVIPGLLNRLLTFSVRIAPRRFILRLMRWWQKPRASYSST